MHTLRTLLIVGIALLLQGCAICPKQCSYKELTVHVTENQEFVVAGKTLTVEEFFAQADYAEGTDLVTLDVAQKSAVSEATISNAIDYLKNHGYQVTMAENSKYAHLTP